MALKNLFSEVEFLAQYPVIGLAVSDSTGPVPGYLFGEINALTYIDNGNNCKMLVSFLISRLKPDTPIVCIKVLKLLLYLVRNGHYQIINEVKIHEVLLKEARSFSGPADDVYGNSFYQMIRKMSKELLDIIFSENRESFEKPTYPDHIALTGYGSEASSKKMTGFGYSIKTEKSVSDVVSDGFSSFVEKLFPSPDKEVEPSAVSHIGDSLPKYKPLVIDKGESVEMVLAADSCFARSIPPPIPKQQRKMKVHRPGRAGGGWESSSEEEDNDDTPPLVIESNKESTESVESMDSRCSSLNCEEILSLSLKKISEVEEYIQLRALVFIEYLLFHDIITLESLVKIVLPFLQKLVEEEKTIKSSVKTKSLKLCKVIEILNKKFQQKVTSEPMKA